MSGGFTFLDIYNMFIFCVALWVAGKFCAKIQLPAIVGEIIVGLFFGPYLSAEYGTELFHAPNPDVLKMLGECGLILLVMEAGVEVDVDTLKLIGGRGVCVAVFGSMVPLGLGFGLSQILGYDVKTSLAMGACLAPTSVGIAITVLKRGNVLNTAIGQLVIAAAVLDDIISLILLSFIQALKDPSVWGMAKPLVVSFGFLFLTGYFAIYDMPIILKWVLKQFDRANHQNVLLGLLFIFALFFIPVTHYAGSSYLLGAFLAGLCFCTYHEAHDAWSRQMKRLMAWLLRLFFGCTIAFEVPILDVWTSEIMGKTFLYFICIIGKVASGVFAPGFFENHMLDGAKIGFAMSAWGEFAFILATASRDEDIINAEQFSSITMAVLLSVVVGPICLTQAIHASNKKKADDMSGGFKDSASNILTLKVDESDVEKFEHSSFYRVVTESKGFWGFYTKVKSAIEALDLVVVDYRTGRKRVNNVVLVQVCMYLKDVDKIDDTTDRRNEITSVLMTILNDKSAKVSVQDHAPHFRVEHSDTRIQGEIYLAKGFRSDQKIMGNATAGEASVLLLKDGVSALLVTDDKDMVLGLITQGDIMRQYTSHDHHHDPSELEIHTFMCPAQNLVRTTKKKSRLQMLNMMANKDIRQILIMDEHGDVESLMECKELLSGITANKDRFDVRLNRPFAKRLSNLFTAHDADLKAAVEQTTSRNMRLPSLNLNRHGSLIWSQREQTQEDDETTSSPRTGAGSTTSQPTNAIEMRIHYDEFDEPSEVYEEESSSISVDVAVGGKVHDNRDNSKKDSKGEIHSKRTTKTTLVLSSKKQSPKRV